MGWIASDAASKSDSGQMQQQGARVRQEGESRVECSAKFSRQLELLQLVQICDELQHRIAARVDINFGAEGCAILVPWVRRRTFCGFISRTPVATGLLKRMVRRSRKERQRYRTLKSRGGDAKNVCLFAYPT